MSQGIKIIFGTASTGFRESKESALGHEILAVLKEKGVDTLDTAQLYGESETVLGTLDAGVSFIIDTKVPGGFGSNAGETLKPEILYNSVHTSLAKLKVKQIDILYVHAPDDTLHPSTWIPTFDKLYKEGVFKRFGLSNFTVPQVQQVYDTAKASGHILPSVYQGNYSPITRKQEEELFPLLRKLNIAFYAYSPLAGGLLTKTKENLITGKDAGRFTHGGGFVTDLYRTMYIKPAILDAVEEWGTAAEKQGVPKAELAHRWVSYHSPLKASQGDGLIIGGRNVEQVQQTIDGLKRGPLKDEVVKIIDDIWEKVKHEAPLDNYNSFLKKG
jgi:aflatoxin B1 aldehyde reductase